MTAADLRAPALPSFARLSWLHAKYQVLETIRVPVAVIGNTVMPALALFFFVVPQPDVASNPVAATTAVTSLGVFSLAASNMFTHGIGVAEDRATAFDPYVRSLPAGPGPRMVGRVLSGMAFTCLSVIPLLLIGWLFTDAALTWGQLLASVALVPVVCLPFILLGLTIGYAMPAKAAIAVVQVTLFPMAFVGGLFLPPFMFADWLDQLSRFVPTRAARDLLVQASTGQDAYSGAWAVLGGWTLVLGVLAVVVYRRDEGRRFR